MSKLWCACLTTETRKPAARKRATTCSTSVVLPEPEKPRKPTTFMERQCRGPPIMIGVSAFAESFQTAVSLVLHADPVLLRTVGLSLLVSTSACAIAAGFGLAAGAWLAVTAF